MIPNLFFKKKIPDKLPEGMLKEAKELGRYETKEECLRKAYDFITTRYRGYMLLVYFRFWDIFISDPFYWWKRPGFMNCTNFNYMLRILLVKSGRFSESDIDPKLTLVTFSLHQYLRIRVENDRWVNVDAWGRNYGIPFGDYGRGFNTCHKHNL